MAAPLGSSMVGPSWMLPKETLCGTHTETASQWTQVEQVENVALIPATPR